MRRVLKLWIGLAVVFAALLAWHQPLRGPLTEAEVREAFDREYSQLLQAEDQQAAAFRDFFLSDDGRPFFMVNLDALPEITPEVEAANRKYGIYMMGQLLPRASYPVLSTNVIVGLANSLGTDLEPFERLVVVRYRSRRDFLEIITAPQFQKELENKDASLDGWYAAPATIGPRLSLPVLLFCLLMVIGVLGSFRAQRTTRAQNSRKPFGRVSRS